MIVCAIPALVYSVAIKERLTPTNGPKIAAPNAHDMARESCRPSIKRCFAVFENKSRAMVNPINPVIARIFTSLNTTGARRVAIGQQILGLPVIAIYKDGQKIDALVKDEATETAIEEMIKKYI